MVHGLWCFLHFLSLLLLILPLVGVFLFFLIFFFSPRCQDTPLCYLSGNIHLGWLGLAHAYRWTLLDMNFITF